jgi:glycosyltransferase involved in cell wall biosynthesis
VTELSITVLIAARNEAANIARCAKALAPAERVLLVDSESTDETSAIAQRCGAEVVQFHYNGGYPKKRQWALDTLELCTPWILLIDADEVVSPQLWSEIEMAINAKDAPEAFLIRKEFHFLGRRFRFGGFSHTAVLLFRKGTARFERLLEDDPSGLDMEVHERIIVDGRIGRLRTPLVHEDFKGLDAYIGRHHRYATWEAALRHRFLATGDYGRETIQPKLFGNAQERRRFLKRLVMRLPFEPMIWFCYHYLVRGALFEGSPGFVACRIRAQYIAEVRAKMKAMNNHEPARA